MPQQSLRSRLALGDSSKSILPFIPRPLKWLFLLFLLLNSRGLPLAWHFRVFRPAIYLRLIHRLRSIRESPEQRIVRLTRLCPVGIDPFASESVFHTRATPDACDFNMHLSNSSYAMSFDMARFKYAIHHFPLFFKDGGWIALGATHYVFTREIPLNARYEIRVSIATWDHKWMYMVAHFVTYPTSKPMSNVSNGTALALPPHITPASSAAPSPSRSPAPPTPPLLGKPLPVGALVHCTAIARLCCKIGRITIPPAIAMVTSGFATTPERFADVQRWRLEERGRRLQAFYKGGWRGVPQGERWWTEEVALGGETERRRKEAMGALVGSVGVSVVLA